MEYLYSYLKEQSNNQVVTSVYQLLRFQFPNIKNLNVSIDKDGKMGIRFDAGDYTKEEVVEFLDKFRKKSMYS